MLRLLFMLVFLALVFFFFYFLWKKKFRYSLYIAIVFLALFSFGVYLGSTAKNTWCLNPHRAFSELPLKLETAEDYFVKGNFAYDQGRCSDAINDYTKAIKLDSTVSQFYNNRGYTYMMKEDYKNALNDFNKAIEIRPNYARAMLNRGDIYARYLVNKQKAIEDYKKVITQGPVAIKDTAVCGRLLMAKYNLFTPGWFFGMVNLVLTGGQNCK